MHIGYFIFDAEVVKQRFEPRDLEHWDEWRERGRA